MQIREEPSQDRGRRRDGKARRMKEKAMADPAKRWKGRDGGGKPGRCSGCLPSARGRMIQQRDPITRDVLLGLLHIQVCIQDSVKFISKKVANEPMGSRKLHSILSAVESDNNCLAGRQTFIEFD